MNKPMAALGGERSEMDSQDNVICAWAWAGLDGLRN